MLSLGIDPGLANCAWSVIDLETHTPGLIDHGTIKTSPTDDMAVRLEQISNGLRQAFQKHQGQIASIGIESFKWHPGKTNKRDETSQAVGVAKAAIIAYLPGISYREFSAKKLKTTIGLRSTATKKQVRETIKLLFGLEKAMCEHRSDATAAAIAAGNRVGVNQ